METLVLFGLQDISTTMETLVLFSFLIYAAMIVAGIVVVIAIWRGMRAHEKMAASMQRMADATERIEETIRRDGGAVHSRQATFERNPLDFER